MAGQHNKSDQWQLIMLWTEGKETELPCSIHPNPVEVIYSMGEAAAEKRTKSGQRRIFNIRIDGERMHASLLDATVDPNDAIAVNPNTPNQWPLFEKIWIEGKGAELPCNLHTSLMVTKRSSNESYVVDVALRGDEYNFQVTRLRHGFPKYDIVIAAPICPLATELTGPGLVDLFRKVYIPTLTEDNKYSCRIWVKDAMFKLYMRNLITHPQWSDWENWMFTQRMAGPCRMPHVELPSKAQPIAWSITFS